MTLFRTTDILNTKTDREIFMNYFVTQAKKCGLEVLEQDLDHIQMLGYRHEFLRYYIRTLKVSVQHGAEVSRELKRIISVLFWR